MNLVILGLIEGTAITMTVLKNITVDLNVKCLNYVRYVHMVSSIHLVSGCSRLLLHHHCNVGRITSSEGIQSS